MEIEESTEAKLLRLLIGYVHVLAANSLAAVLAHKPIHKLSEDDQGQIFGYIEGAAKTAASKIDLKSLPPKGGTPPVVH